MGELTALTLNGQETKITDDAMTDFAAQFRGNLIRPGDTEYDEARKIWNGMIDRKPALIARCSGTADVVAAVKFARRHNLLASTRSGGHNVGGRSICDRGLVIDLSGMRGVTVDPEAGIARAQGGALLGDIDHETHAHGMVTPLGVVTATGAAGLTVHGGFGWLSRRYGLSLDNLVSVEIVTADGEIRTASEKTNDDLFWGVRGNAGDFGVVTRLDYKLHPMKEDVTLLFTFYSVSDAAQILRFLREQQPNSPDELSMIGVFWNAPDEEFIPEEHRGQPVFILAGCYSGPRDNGDEVIKPFREIATPIADISGPIPFIQLQKLLDPDYPNGRLYYWKSIYMNELNDEVIQLLIDSAASRPSPLTSLDVWFIGGAVNRVPADKTAFAQRQAPFMAGIEANWEDPAQSEANIAWARHIFDELRKRDDAGMYLNFPGYEGESDAVVGTTFGPNYDRLRQLKAKYDPDNFFRGFLSSNGAGK
jgi:hypothetical protein